MHFKKFGDCVGRQGVSVDTTFDPPPFVPSVFVYPPAFKGGMSGSGFGIRIREAKRDLLKEE